MREALRQSQKEKAEFHRRAIEKLNAQYAKLQNRIDQIYLDKLDGEVEETFYSRSVSKWHVEPAQVRTRIERHEKADQNYIERGSSSWRSRGMPNRSTGTGAKPSGRPSCASSCPALRSRMTGWSRPSSLRSTSSTGWPRKRGAPPTAQRNRHQRSPPMPVQSCSPGRTRTKDRVVNNLGYQGSAHPGSHSAARAAFCSPTTPS